MHLDRTNLRMLELLQRDARMSITELARAVDRAESTVRERLAALERAGVIRGYRAVLEASRLGAGARAVVRADCDRRRLPDLAKRLAAVPNVIEATATAGGRALAIHLVAESLGRLERVLEERIAPLGLERVEVDIVLQPLVEARPLDLSALGLGAEPLAEGARVTNGEGLAESALAV